MRRPSTRLANRPAPAAPLPEPHVGPDAWAGATGPPRDLASPHGGRPQVLVADPRHAVTADVSYHLARVGFQVTTVLSGGEALAAVRLREPDLAVLGPGLAGVDASEIVRRLRAAPHADAHEVGALMLLGPDADAADRSDALALGADDCMAWPGDARELVLRAGAIARRYAHVRPRAGEVLRCGPLAIDAGSAEVRVHGAPVHFTRAEFELLRALVRHRGELLPRDRLVVLAWGARGVGGRRRVDRHVYCVREKLGPLGAWIETVSRRGYRFAPPAGVTGSLHDRGGGETGAWEIPGTNGHDPRGPDTQSFPPNACASR